MIPLSFCVFIPAYHAAKTLPDVLKRIPDSAWEQITAVYIINDGSRDETETVVQKLLTAHPKIHLHSFPENRGYGHAVRQGLSFAQQDRAEYAVCLHADGQYPPEYMAEFVADMARDRIDILQGSRHLAGTARQGGMPLYKLVAGKILVWLENAVFGLNLTDYHSGYVFYSRRALTSIPFERLSPSFDFDLEVIASARTGGLAIAEQAIPTRYADEKSHLNPITYGLRVLRVLLRYQLGAYRTEPST